jgi:hypothetical protein
MSHFTPTDADLANWGKTDFCDKRVHLDAREVCVECGRHEHYVRFYPPGSDFFDECISEEEETDLDMTTTVKVFG